MPASRRRKDAPKPVPTLHLVMMLCTVFLIVLSGIAYLLAPESKAAQILNIMTLLVGFFAGKLTNGFRTNVPAKSPEADNGEDA